MLLYLIIIALANILIILFNLPSPFDIKITFYINFASIFSTVAVILVDGITALIIRKMPEKFFAADNSFFNVGMSERRFYKKIKIKAWKSRIPELGGFTGFHKNKIESYDDKNYLARFLLESNYGVIIHIANAVFGFLIIMLPFKKSITIPVAVVNFVLSLLPAAVLRYNTPILKKLYLKSK